MRPEVREPVRRPGDEHRQPPAAHPRREAALIGETEAFLQGSIIEHLTAAGRMVPAWAVLNKLAHASLSELAELAGSDGCPSRAPESDEPVWCAAQRSLAARLLARGARPDEITRVQREVLMPLVLWLIERAELETVTLRHAVSAARDALGTGE